MTQRNLQHILLPDDSELRLTVAVPESAVRGGIVVVPEARGVTDAVWRLAGDLAGEGWLAVIPHLYHRDGADELPPDSAPEQVRSHVERLSAESLHIDTDAALRWLAQRGVTADRIGVVGFGLGGAVALIVATQRDLGAAVTVDGIGVVQPVAPTLPALVEVAPDLRCPWLGIYGAGSSEVPEEEVHKLRDAAHSAQVATDLVHYCVDTHRSTEETWARTLNWFDSHLR